jgi:hypothetical protein
MNVYECIYNEENPIKRGFVPPNLKKKKKKKNNSYTGPPGYLGWTRFQPTYVDGFSAEQV